MKRQSRLKKEITQQQIDFANRLRNKRLEANLSLQEVANQIGVSKVTLSRYETLDIVNIPSDKIELLAKVYHTSPSYLMGWTTPTSDTTNSKLVTEYKQLVDKIPDLHEAIKLYSALDPYDRSEIRGEMKGMLRNPKYKPLIKEKTMG